VRLYPRSIYEGSGIRLAICKGIADIQQGTTPFQVCQQKVLFLLFSYQEPMP